MLHGLVLTPVQVGVAGSQATEGMVPSTAAGMRGDTAVEGGGAHHPDTFILPMMLMEVHCIKFYIYVHVFNQTSSTCTCMCHLPAI